MKLEVAEIQYNLENLVFGSDEEQAMRKAISVCFPTSKQVLCCRHIRENVGNYLVNKVGVRDRGRILDLLFGEFGVAKADDILLLDRRSASLQTEIGDLPPTEHKRLCQQATQGAAQ